MILGLDVSTSITGICILNDNNQIVFNDYIDTRKYKCFFEKVAVAKKRLSQIGEEYNITHVYIEQSLQSFRSGFSSAKTLSTLARFNGVISWLCYEMWSIKPEYIAATSARKLCGIKVPRGTKAKEVVINYLLDNEQTFVVEYTKHGNIKQHYYDMADSIVVARAARKIMLDNQNEI
jgi:Holliday junction resolvasome RuvABC endonuclease subunit